MKSLRRAVVRGTLVTCSLVVVMYTVQYQIRTNVQYISATDDTNSTRPLAPRDQVVPQRPFDVMVNSYMRSGSSFTGQLLAFRPDTFYWYEPLWNYHSGVYYMGPKLCFGTSGCSLQNANAQLTTRKMQDVLASIYSCNFTYLQAAVAHTMTYLPVYAGECWAPYRDCQANNTSGTNCLKLMEDVCKRAKHRDTKVVRMTVDNLDAVLAQRSNLKVIHLFRDPRAIINSRISTTWYTLKDVTLGGASGIKTDAGDLCRRMAYDLNATIHLRKKYPDRFALVMFEDMQEDLLLKANLLYQYFGINRDGLEEKLASMTGILQHEHSVNNSNDFSQWWRYHLSFAAIQIVQEQCVGVMKTLGYKIFNTHNETIDMAINSYSFDNSLLIENIRQDIQYNIT